MFDITKRIEAKNMIAKDLKEFVNSLPDECEINFNGDNYGYIHVEEDLSAVSFDDNSLDDEYEQYNGVAE